jgi:hypothetical protein
MLPYLSMIWLYRYLSTCVSYLLYRCLPTCPQFWIYRGLPPCPCTAYMGPFLVTVLYLYRQSCGIYICLCVPTIQHIPLIFILVYRHIHCLYNTNCINTILPANHNGHIEASLPVHHISFVWLPTYGSTDMGARS